MFLKFDGLSLYPNLSFYKLKQLIIGQKSNILALVAGLHSQKSLKDLGFAFSHKQYKLAREKAVIGQFDLNPGEKIIPQSKTRISEGVVEKINNILFEKSLPSSKTIVQAQKNGQKTIKEVRMLQDTKKNIYWELKNRFPEIKLSLSKFYTLCSRNFKRASKRTDVCNVCVAGDQYRVELDSMVRSGNIDIFRMATLQRLMVEYNDHMELNRKQRDAFKTQQENLNGRSCVIVADFKENFRIGGGPVEASSSFYRKKQISDLCFCIIYKEDGQIVRKYFNYLSENLSHDSFYAINCLNSLLALEDLARFTIVHLWSDSGPHFKNSDYIHAVFFQIPRIFPQKKLSLNFFFENHGKSDVDGHFVVLSRWFSHAEAHQNINTITELKECFERKAHADSLTRGNGNAGKYNFKVYPRDVPRSERYQVKIKDGIKLFLSYIFIEGKLLASPICSEDLASYNPVVYKETKISDKRSNKYASNHIQRGSFGDALMGPYSIEIQTKMVGMLRGVRGGGERERFLSNDGHCER
ncbi:hypothetical protein BB560_007177 [Smittium megazygosporum]|uniref:Uncharacterized protein n=1 Tax=Smittium megazygosporum TaxID=133381 RepID=A0A2T9XYA6_9FUNG|nr:hypothetical protein BB560_007177 [Smittium megazygosporum]